MSTQNEKFMNNTKKQIMSEERKKSKDLETVDKNTFEIRSYKSLDKYWFKMNSELPEKCRCETMERALEDIKHSKDCFALWTGDHNDPNLMTTGLTPDLFESNVVRMVTDESYRKFSKLSVAVAEDYIKDNKRGLETLEISKKYINEKLADYVPQNELEG